MWSCEVLSKYNSLEAQGVVEGPDVNDCCQFYQLLRTCVISTQVSMNSFQQHFIHGTKWVTNLWGSCVDMTRWLQQNFEVNILEQESQNA